MERSIRRVADPEQQEAENYLYWQSIPVGDRLSAVCDVSRAACAFAAAFKGSNALDDRGHEGLASPFERARG